MLWCGLLTTAHPAHAFDNVVGIVPKDDACTQIMTQALPKILPSIDDDQADYFNRPIPRVIHQIVARSEDKATFLEASPWPQYAKARNFAHRVWSLGDIESELEGQYPHFQQAMSSLLAARRTDAAQQLLQLAILAEYGGIFASAGVHPPRLNGAEVELDRYLHLRGLCLTTSLRARAVSNTSLYITHSLMAAAPHHPWISQMVVVAADNVLKAEREHNLHLPARYLCGNALLSRNLTGVFTVLPFTYLQTLNMFPLGPNEGSEDALD